MELNFNQQFQNIKLKRNLLQKLQTELSNLEKALNSKKNKRKELKWALDKEYQEFKDIDSIFTLPSIFYAVRGDRQEKLEKEKQEYLNAKLQNDKLHTEVDLMEKRKEELLLEIKGLENIEEEFQKTLKEKEKYLISLNNPTSKELINLSEKLGELEISAKETQKINQAGIEIIEILDLILSKLDSAKLWGTLDRLGSQSGVGDIMKYSKLDETKELISKTQCLLDSYGRKLKDVDLNISRAIDIGGFDTFADVFLDGWIADRFIQKKIKKSISHIAFIKNKMLDIQNKVLADYKVFEAEINKMREIRKKLITK